MPLSELIRRLDTTLYKEYIFEAYLEKGQGQPPSGEEDAKKAVFKKKKEYKPAKPTALIGCPSLNTLGPDHPARAYMEWRKLPPKALEELYWTDHFPATVDKFLPEHQYALVDEGRIIIPFYDTNHQLIALQGRSQPRYDAGTGKWVDSPGAVRYITIKADKDAPRIFGMNKLDKMTKRIYIVEGPLDSLFLPNAVAMAGSDIPSGFPKDRTVVVYDNEKHKADTVKKIAKAIESGFTVCIWPDNISEKDINLMVLSGYKPEKIREIIDTNLYSGLQAKIQLQHWANPQGFAGKGNVASLTLKRYNN
jgi:hypothetical protein